jgi:hypothetical protein
MTILKRCTQLTILLICCLFRTVSAQEVLTNQSLIQMSQMKVSSNVIVTKIRASRNNFDLTTNGLLQLLSAKVPASVIEATLQGVWLSDVMTNEDVIRLWDANLSRKLLTQKITSSQSRFDMTTSGLIQLKTGKVPDQIVNLMMVTPAKPSGVSNKQQGAVVTQKAESTTQRTTFSINKGVKCTSWLDKFTKATVTVSQVILRGKKGSNILLGRSVSKIVGIEDLEVTLLFRRDNKETVLVMYASEPGINNLLVTRDKPFLLLMNDESVMEFKPVMDAEYGISFDYAGYGINSKLCVYYAINKDQLNQLSKKIVKAYRLHTYNKNYYEDTVNLSRAEQVQQGALCMLNSSVP